MLRVETIEQFYVLQFIKKDFDLKYVELQLEDKFSIKVLDAYNDELVFSYNVKNGKIEYSLKNILDF